jgi:hypothetical protein
MEGEILFVQLMRKLELPGQPWYSIGCEADGEYLGMAEQDGGQRGGYLKENEYEKEVRDAWIDWECCLDGNRV